MTRVKLLFPPHFSIYQPYLSLPALTAFLRERGIFVSQDDLNLSSFYYFMQPEYLQQCQDKLENILQIYEKKDALPKKFQLHYDLICKALLSAPLIIPNVKDAIEFFHSNDEFLDFNKYSLQERIIQEAMRIITATRYPTRISLVDFLMNYSPESSKDIFEAIEDEETNPYIPYFKDYVVNELIKYKPDLVGISLTAMSQVIPGLTLANIIKQNLPEVKIVVGGVIPTHLSQKIKAIPRLFTLFDFLIKGEGETPLYKLCRYIAGETSLDSVPNLIYSENGSIKETQYLSIEEVNALPTPDYDGFHLEKYLSPLPVLSVEPARGCYWRKCTFCNQYSVHGNTFRLRNPRLIIADIKKLQDKYDTHLFNISNEGVPASHLRRISEKIVETGINIQWYAGAQIKRSFSNEVCPLLRKAGCQKLIFGLESGSHRVLNIMKKGIVLEEVPQILQNCIEAGIDTHLYLMIGFPTETFEEIKATQDFVLKVLSNVKKEGFTFYISVFQPMIASPIINQLSHFGYEITPREKDHDLAYIFEHYPNDEMIPHLSRGQLEEISANISSIIYSHLPSQTIPEELTHYMCYHFLGHISSEQPTENYVSQEMVCKSLPKNQDYIEKSKWVSLRRIRFVNNPLNGQRHMNIIAYNLLKNKYYLLNKSAADYLDSLETPKTVDHSLKVGLNTKSNIKVNSEHNIIHLLKENLIVIRRRQK